MRVTADARARRRRRRAGASGAVGCTALALVGAALAGCSSGSSIAQPLTSRTPAAALSPSATESPTSSPKDAVLAQYRGFWTTLTPASLAPATQRRSLLAPYAADPELSSLLQGLTRDHEEGRVYYGTPTLRPTVTTLSVERKVAVVRDCQDATKTGDKDATSGRLLTKGMPRTLVVSTLHLLDDGNWRVVFVTFPKQPC